MSSSGIGLAGGKEINPERTVQDFLYIKFYLLFFVIKSHTKTFSSAKNEVLKNTSK